MAPTRAEVLHLETFLPYQLNVVTQAVSQGLAQLYADEFGITVPEWRVIATLGEQPPGTELAARDIARHSRMGKVMTSRAAAALLSRRILGRRMNRDDRRESFLRLSEKGLEIYAAIVPRALAYQQRLEAGLSRADAAAFQRVLAHFLARAEDHEALQMRGELQFA